MRIEICDRKVGKEKKTAKSKSHSFKRSQNNNNMPRNWKDKIKMLVTERHKLYKVLAK